MSGKPTTPYHMDQQYADALLRPVGATLAEIEVRLTHYLDRLHLSAGDRARVEVARDLIAAAHLQLLPVLDQSDAPDLSRDET